VSDCPTCSDRRLVGGFLPAWCPDCGPPNANERMRANEYTRLVADRDRLARELEATKAFLQSSRIDRESFKSERDEARAEVERLCTTEYALERWQEVHGKNAELAAKCEAMRVQGIDECIGILASRRAHYECYRTGDMMTTHPATFAIINELLVFMQAHRERALAAQDKEASK
jgi:hypothetical protein